MTHNPRLTCLNASIDFPLFYNRLASSKSTPALMFSGILTQVTYINLTWFSRQQHTLVSADSYTSCSSPLFLSTLLSLSVTRCGFLK
ncbi:unnamed protein product [Hymenolepis diminuta]|uniref:Uncharacterized protein n=1 Tax=Hymenolepis diminuta TaxID=6216 RepID=A0A564YQW8_HYMDI|nr:unnamed protein product [Hymenolepis diminuta]